eukprot:5207841-Pleurochrysis_carterae.AAC.1
MSLHTKELCPLSRPQPYAHSANKSCQPVRDLRAKSSNNFERHVSLPGCAMHAVLTIKYKSMHECLDFRRKSANDNYVAVQDLRRPELRMILNVMPVFQAWPLL